MRYREDDFLGWNFLKNGNSFGASGVRLQEELKFDCVIVEFGR